MDDARRSIRRNAARRGRVELKVRFFGGRCGALLYRLIGQISIQQREVTDSVFKR
jgi:hypothetical protein